MLPKTLFCSVWGFALNWKSVAQNRTYKQRIGPILGNALYIYMYLNIGVEFGPFFAV